MKVDDSGENSESEVVLNRVRLRKYLRELDYYQKSLIYKNAEDI